MDGDDRFGLECEDLALRNLKRADDITRKLGLEVGDLAHKLSSGSSFQASELEFDPSTAHEALAALSYLDSESVRAKLANRVVACVEEVLERSLQQMSEQIVKGSRFAEETAPRNLGSGGGQKEGDDEDEITPRTSVAGTVNWTLAVTFARNIQTALTLLRKPSHSAKLMTTATAAATAKATQLSPTRRHSLDSFLPVRFGIDSAFISRGRKARCVIKCIFVLICQMLCRTRATGALSALDFMTPSLPCKAVTPPLSSPTPAIRNVRCGTLLETGKCATRFFEAVKSESAEKRCRLET